MRVSLETVFGHTNLPLLLIAMVAYFTQITMADTDAFRSEMEQNQSKTSDPVAAPQISDDLRKSLGGDSLKYDSQNSIWFSENMALNTIMQKRSEGVNKEKLRRMLQILTPLSNLRRVSYNKKHLMRKKLFE